MKKIFHLADIHIRGYQYLDEMNFSFEQLYALMDKEIINHPYDQFCTVIAGDMFHSKLTVTNEYFDTAHGFLQSLASRTPVVIIPGNHDLSLPNKDRLDAISPIVKSLYGKTKFNIQYSKHSEILKSFWRTGELEKNDENIYFHHFSIIDNKDKWPGKASFVSASFNVALYHGSINNSKVDSGWVSRGNQDDISIFDGYDMALLGDIHMSQFLTSTIAYPGSLRQNNFGETLDKGLILWKISDDYKIVQGERIILPQKKYFITFFCKDENDIIEIKDIPKGCRFKVKLTKEINIVEEIKIKNKIQEYYQPSGEPEIILPDDLDDTDIKLEVEENNDILQENFRDIEVQKSLIRRFFNEKNLSNKDFEDLFELDKVYHTSIKTDLMRNIKWTIDKLQWSNLFSYGKDNILDFENYRGTICLVGKNGSGKSSIIDIINFIIFNSISKEGGNKNFDYINNKCKTAYGKIAISLNDEKYFIERTIKKIGKPKDEKVDNEVIFYKIDKNKKKIMLNGETKPDTNQEIRNIFGTIDDFSVTSLCSQFGLSKFIDAKGTERKKTISKFSDLDIFDEKFKLASEDSKEIKSQLKIFDIQKLTNEITLHKINITVLKNQEELKNKELDNLNFNLSTKEKLLENLKNSIIKFEFNIDKNSLIKEKNITQKFLESKQNELNDLISLINKTFEKIGSLNELQLKEELQKINTIKGDIISTESLLKKAKFTSDLIKKIPNQTFCETCVLAKNAYDAQREHSSLDESLQKLKSSYSNERETELILSINFIEKLESDTKTLKFLSDTIELTQSKLKKIDSELDLCLMHEENLEKNKIIQNEIFNISNDISLLKNEEISIKNSLKLIIKDIIIAETNIENIENQLTKANVLFRKSFLYNLYLECMGKDGISYWIMSKKMPIINNILNKILSQIWKGKAEILNNEEEKTVKIIYQDQDGKRTAEVTSGAEKAVLSLALRTAFWYVSCLPKSPILLLDEAFSYIENDKIDSVLKSLNFLKNYFENIVIITHNDELKSYFDHILYVSKNGYAKLEA